MDWRKHFAERIDEFQKTAEETLKISNCSKTITLDCWTVQYFLSYSRYIDVRTKEEFNNGHLENAVNIPYMFYTKKGWVKNPKFVDKVLAVCGKEDRLIVGCQDGARSEHACNDLRDAEFRHVSNMGGGYSALVANGSYVITKPEPTKPKLSFVARICRLF